MNNEYLNGENKQSDEEKTHFDNVPNQTDDVKKDDAGVLDDTNLSDDFVIGQDFFIDDSGSIELEEPQNVKPTKRKRKKSAGQSCLTSVIWMASILIVAIGAAFTLLYFGMDYLGVSFAEDSAEANIEIVVEKGDSAKEIAEMLEEKGVINSPLFFRFYASQSGHAAKFRNGVYYFSKQDSYEDIAEKLVKQGEQADQVKVTIPEGWTVDQIAERLEQNGVCSKSQFKEAVNEANITKYPYEFMAGIRTETQGVHYRLEGYLYPDTYYFYATNSKSGAEQAIKKMLDNFDKKITPEMRARAEELGYSLHDIITLASIIELESSVADYSDKQKVSAVFWNRLNDWGDGAYLQSDPTTKYKYNKEIYDTYKSAGLAPGAYCSPSFDSIRAALNPDAACTAFYFVTDKNMKFYFNDTYNQHNKTIRDLKNKGLWA